MVLLLSHIRVWASRRSGCVTSPGAHGGSAEFPVWALKLRYPNASFQRRTIEDRIARPQYDSRGTSVGQ